MKPSTGLRSLSPPITTVPPLRTICIAWTTVTVEPDAASITTSTPPSDSSWMRSIGSITLTSIASSAPSWRAAANRKPSAAVPVTNTRCARLRSGGHDRRQPEVAGAEDRHGVARSNWTGPTDGDGQWLPDRQLLGRDVVGKRRDPRARQQLHEVGVPAEQAGALVDPEVVPVDPELAVADRHDGPHGHALAFLHAPSRPRPSVNVSMRPTTSWPGTDG